MLTAIFVKNAGPGRHGDGNGLYLLVKPDGRKTWVFRYRDRVTGKLRDKGLGSTREVSLAQARELAIRCRASLRAGIDPIEARREALQAARAERAKQVTFASCVEQCIATIQTEWKNKKHKAQWEATLANYCSSLADLPVASIQGTHVYQVLEPIWLSKTETATRLRSRIERVLDWATARGYRTGENPARWRGNLQSLLPSPAKVKNVQHRPALPYSEVPELMAELAVRDDLSSQCLRLQILTATRPGEATGAQWSEFDLTRKCWSIPGARTKTGKQHEVPLSAPAMELLQSLGRTKAPFLFPGRAGRPITTAAPLKILKALRPGTTCHGFRSSFRDWAAEQTVHPREVAELALGHAIKSKTEAAYFRSLMYKKRVPLMADWGAFCTPLRS